MWKTVGTIALALLGLIVLLAVGLVAYLSITEYNPPAEAALPVTPGARAAGPARAAGLKPGDGFSILSFNVGYGGLGEESDFFMDGGEQVRPASKALVEKNLTGLVDILDRAQADFYLLQEVDLDSKRSYHIDETEVFLAGRAMDAAHALNYSCAYVPYPLPPIGRVQSGLYTMSAYPLGENAARLALPCPFSWPVRVANLKRCLLVARVPLAGSGQELVLVNLHLEAYDDGEGKAAQTEMLMGFLQAEYEKGNYVVAGGDFNCSFPVVDPAAWPILEDGTYVPGVIEAGALPPSFQWAVDPASPTCRLLNKPLAGPDAAQYYVIDGFILSPNVELAAVETLDEGFRFSDHNPVRLEARLVP